MLQIKIRAYPEMSILALDDNFGLNLCGMPTTCCVVIILGVEVWQEEKVRGSRY